MKITKFGHSCLLVEEGEARILFDPGNYTSNQNDVQNVDAILITHEHPDHMDTDGIKTILGNNQDAKIYTNAGVGAKLKEVSIEFELLEDGQSIEVKGVLIEGFGSKHAHIHDDFTILINTGYRIAKKFFYGGDSVDNVVECEVLAYTACAPWLKVEWAVENAKKIKPKVCFPVHDAFLGTPGPFYIMPERLLTSAGIKWQVIENGGSAEF